MDVNITLTLTGISREQLAQLPSFLLEAAVLAGYDRDTETGWALAEAVTSAVPSLEVETLDTSGDFGVERTETDVTRKLRNMPEVGARIDISAQCLADAMNLGSEHSGLDLIRELDPDTYREWLYTRSF
jgi:hypothetical protein